MEHYFNLFLRYLSKFNRLMLKTIKFIFATAGLLVCLVFTIGVVLFVYSGAFDGFVILFGWCIEINGQCSSNVYYDFMKWMHEVISRSGKP